MSVVVQLRNSRIGKSMTKQEFRAAIDAIERFNRVKFTDFFEVTADNKVQIKKQYQEMLDRERK